MNELRPGDPRYPALLGAIPSAPALFVRGELHTDDALAVAIVGSRRATPYGIAAAERLAADLAARGVTVVRRPAPGVATPRHPGALAAGGPAPAPPRGGGGPGDPPADGPRPADVQTHR